MPVDRRTFLATAAGALVASRASAQDAYLSELYAKAKKEGEVSWYIAHWGTEIAERVAKAFSEVYPGIRTSVVRATGQVIYQRLTQDMKNGVPNCDVFGSGDPGHYVSLTKINGLLQYEPKNLAFSGELARNYDPTHHYTITEVNTAVLCYNTTTVPEADAPKRWTDVLDPKWKGQVAIAHPGFSGSAGGLVLALTKMYGWEFFEKLAANKPFVTRSAIEATVAVTTGERKVGFAPGSLSTNLGKEGKPIATVYTADGTYLQFGATGIPAATSRPNAAKLFLEFLLSKEAGNIIAAESSVPVRTDVTPKPGVARLADLKGFTCTPEEIAEKVPGLTEKWRDVFGI